MPPERWLWGGHGDLPAAGPTHRGGGARGLARGPSAARLARGGACGLAHGSPTCLGAWSAPLPPPRRPGWARVRVRQPRPAWARPRRAAPDGLAGQGGACSPLAGASRRRGGAAPGGGPAGQRRAYPGEPGERDTSHVDRKSDLHLFLAWARGSAGGRGLAARRACFPRPGPGGSRPGAFSSERLQDSDGLVCTSSGWQWDSRARVFCVCLFMNKRIQNSEHRFPTFLPLAR